MTGTPALSPEEEEACVFCFLERLAKENPEPPRGQLLKVGEVFLLNGKPMRVNRVERIYR